VYINFTLSHSILHSALFKILKHNNNDTCKKNLVVSICYLEQVIVLPEADGGPILNTGQLCTGRVYRKHGNNAQSTVEG